MSELDAQIGLQAALLDSGLFQPDLVTINDHRILDTASVRGARAVIESADDVSMLPLTNGALVYGCLITLYEPFSAWDASLTAFQQLRDGVLAAIIDYDHALMELRTATLVEYQYRNYVDSAESREALPLYIRQTLLARIHVTR